MDRKDLEVALAYAVRDREAAVGRGLTYSRTDWEAGARDVNPLVLDPVEPVERPEWLQDGCLILPPDAGLFTPAYKVHIGNDRICLVSREGSDQPPHPVDTSALVKAWRPVPAVAVL